MTYSKEKLGKFGEKICQLFEATPVAQKSRCNEVQARFYWAPVIEIKKLSISGQNEFEFLILMKNNILYFIYRISNIEYISLLFTIIIN